MERVVYDRHRARDTTGDTLLRIPWNPPCATAQPVTTLRPLPRMAAKLPACYTPFDIAYNFDQEVPS
jgi:hypothetical protein